MKRQVTIIIISLLIYFPLNANNTVILKDELPQNMSIGAWGGTSTADFEAGTGKDGGNGLKIILNNPSEYSGCYIALPAPLDLFKNRDKKSIIFWIKGEKGGEPVNVLLVDSDKDGDMTEEYKLNTTLSLKPYVNITKEWQKVAIPLTDFPKTGMNWVDPPRDNLPHSGPFDWSEVTTLLFMLQNKDITVYIDEIVISTAAEGQKAEKTVNNLKPGRRKISNIKTDHIGYRISGKKTAIISWPAGEFDNDTYIKVNSSTKFHLKDRRDNIIFESTLRGPVFDKSSGDTVYLADFSSYKKPIKSVYLEVPGLGKSLKFNISDQPYEKALWLGMKGYYYQRCGLDLQEKHAGKWTHKACHLDDGYYYFEEEGKGQKKSIGGWHDAGDYGKKMMTAGPTVHNIMLMCEMFPDKIASLNLNIPESGNGIPDILNEVKYELDWIFTMQEANGAVHHELIPLDFQISTPAAANPKRYFWKLSSFATGDFVGAMAIAARVYKKYDKEYAAKCLKKAELSWKWLEENPGVYPPDGFHRKPPTPQTLGYGDTEDKDERFWAAAELYLTTGKDKYQDYVKKNYNENFWIPGWKNVDALGVIAYILSDHSNTDKAFQSKMKKKFLELADSLLTKFNAHPYKIGLDAFWWGSNSVIMYQSMVMLIAHRLTGDNKYLEGAEEQLHYILGRNALGISFLAGSSENSVLHIHHLWQGNSDMEGAIPGLLSGGPNQYMQDAVIKSELDPSTPPAKCFVDIHGAYSCNENDIIYSAPFVFTAGYLHFMEK